MNTIIKLAWRNIWRNKRRTLITAASIMFAVFFASFTSSIQKGVWDHMLDNVVNFYFGYAQIHQNGYWDEQSIDKAFVVDPTVQELTNTVEGVEHLVPRVESFALSSFGERTQGVLVVGVDPVIENELTALKSRLVDGAYFDPSSSVLVAEGVQEKLGLELRDTLVLISQGFRGANAAGKYVISGILKFGSPDLNKRMVYLPLKDAQWFFGMEDQVTTLALKIPNRKEVPAIINQITSQIDTSAYEVMGWESMIPELVEAKEVDTAGNKLVLLILYLIIGFGIFGTILMMTKEREYEFGVLVAIGMKRWQLATVIWIETFLIGLLGAIIGILVSMPLVYYFKVNPIDLSVMGENAVETYEKFGIEAVLPAVFEPGIFISQALIIFLITTVLALYPWWKIGSLQPVKAMRA